MANNIPAYLTILVVDDFEDSRFMLRRMLEMNDYCVLEAADGRQAIETVRGNCPDLILMDLNMPEMDGLTLVRQLRGMPGYKHTPLLVLTTEGTTERKMAGREAGATGWMVKPFNPQKLLAAVAKVLA